MKKQGKYVNLKLVGIATVILFFVTASNLTNYVFAQSDLGSQMDTAKKVDDTAE